MHILPPSLLDLISVRASLSLRQNSRNSTFTATLCTRGAHQTALATVPSSGDIVHFDQAYTRRRVKRRREGSLAVRPSHHRGPSKSLSILEEKVQALQSTVANEVHLQPGLSEDDLVSIYEDLLAPTTPNDTQESPPQTQQSQAEADHAMMLAVEQRLFNDVPELALSITSPLTSTLRSLRAQASSSSNIASNEQAETGHYEGQQHGKSHQTILIRLKSIVEKLDAVRATVDSGTMQDNLPISLLSIQEWQSLIRTCIQEQDLAAAELSVQLMKRSGIIVPEDCINVVLEYYAMRGDVVAAEQFMAESIIGTPTHRQRDLHIKTHLQATPPKTIPSRALSILHHYETLAIPAPMRSYTRLITSLFSTDGSIGYAQAWDLFTHMRYVAYPNPDATLYTLMIRACASSLTARAEPERALDLWTEMTVDRAIQPSAGTYAAVILACARSGSKAYIHEAFRLAKEMLDAHRDAYGRPAFRPDGRMFSALLEGAKRVGDLARTRWILAEMVRWGDDNESGFENAEITEEIMMHVFHAYAAYKPPFNRSSTVLVDRAASTTIPPENLSTIGNSPAVDILTNSRNGSESRVTTTEIPRFAHLPPQSRSEVIGEVKALFTRIPNVARGASPELTGLRFDQVRLTPRLLNSYLSVHYAHATFEESEQLFRTIFEEFGVSRNVRSYVEALERCAGARRGHERTVGHIFGNWLWSEWQALENGEASDISGAITARLIERANVAIIRVWTLNDDLERALDQVKAFAERHPPLSVSQPVPKHPFRSTRTVLQGQRPLVRMTSTVELPDDTVPPLLTFSDVEILHHRLVAAGRMDAVGYLKWLCKAYEGALRARRNLTMRAEPPKQADKSL